MSNSLNCFFVTDLHGSIERYRKLFDCIEAERPAAIFMGGDILPSPLKMLTAIDVVHQDFINDFLVKELMKLRIEMGEAYPRIFLILGNDDGRMEEAAILDAAARKVWEYCHNRRILWHDFSIYGYAYIPPSPFRLKDWERYDVSRFVDPGCTAPAEGMLSFPVSESELNFATIAEDLEKLVREDNLEQSIFLFHSPPYKSKLDRAALDGQMIDYVPLDVHIGSIAIQRFIENRQPLVTLHGHVHESTRLTGSWKDRSGRTCSFNAAHEGPELSLVRFNPREPELATRELL